MISVSKRLSKFPCWKASLVPTWKDSCNLNINHLCPSTYIAVISVISCNPPIKHLGDYGNPPKIIWPLGRWWSISARHSLLWAEGRPMLWLPGWMSEAQDLHLFIAILSRRTKLRNDQRCQLLQPLLFCWGLHFWRLDQLPSTALSSSNLMYQGAMMDESWKPLSFRRGRCEDVDLFDTLSDLMNSLCI